MAKAAMIICLNIPAISALKRLPAFFPALENSIEQASKKAVNKIDGKKSNSLQSAFVIL